MAIEFKGPGITKHGRLILAPQMPMSFEDEHAEDYFKAMGWAEDTDKDPVFTYPEGSVEIDPKTVYGDGEKKGQLVMPHLAKAADEAEAAPAETSEQEA